MIKLQRKQTGDKLTPGRKLVRGSFTILLLLLCLGTGMAAGQEIYFEPGDTTLAGVGHTETLNFYLDQAPAGLSGYNLTLGISDPSVVRITGVEFPDWSGMLNTSSELPANSVCIEAIDLEINVNAGDTNVLLGSVTVESLALGEGNITVSISHLDDDDGNAFLVDIREAKMAVIAPPASPSSSSSSSSSKGSARVISSVETPVPPVEEEEPEVIDEVSGPDANDEGDSAGQIPDDSGSQGEAEYQEPKPLESDPDTPGFEMIFAVIGLLMAVYLVKRY